MKHLTKIRSCLVLASAVAIAACSALDPKSDDAPASPLDADVAAKLSSLWSEQRLVTQGELPFEFCVAFGQLPGPCRVYKLSSGRATNQGYDATCRLEVSTAPHGVALFGEGVENYEPDEPLSSFLTASRIQGDETTLSENSEDPLYGSPITWKVSASGCQEFMKK